jgi:hypothetical protein
LFYYCWPFRFQRATSVVPGWHTTIYTPGFVGSFIVLIIGVFVTIGYWQVSKRADKTGWTLFATHFLLTLPALIVLNFPSILLDVEKTGLKDLTKRHEISNTIVMDTVYYRTNYLSHLLHQVNQILAYYVIRMCFEC